MDFNQFAEKGNKYLDEVATELGFPEDRKLAMRMLRSTLHVLRDRITIQESFQLIAQLPLALKAVYVDGWKYNEKPDRSIKNIHDYVKHVVHEDQPVAHHDIQTVKDGENAVRSVFKVIKSHISHGEVDDIKATLPEDLRALW